MSTLRPGPYLWSNHVNPDWQPTSHVSFPSWQQNCKFIVLGHNNFCCGLVYIHFFPLCDCSMKDPIFSISSFAFLCIWKLHKVTGPKRVTSHFLSLFLLYKDKSSCTSWTKIQVDLLLLLLVVVVLVVVIVVIVTPHFPTVGKLLVSDASHFVYG